MIVSRHDVYLTFGKVLRLQSPTVEAHDYVRCILFYFQQNYLISITVRQEMQCFYKKHYRHIYRHIDKLYSESESTITAYCRHDQVIYRMTTPALIKYFTGMPVTLQGSCASLR